jgi:hypothetical protein
MVNISLTLYTKGFFGSFLKSPTQMGSLSINNSVTNISRLGTFKVSFFKINFVQLNTGKSGRRIKISVNHCGEDPDSGGPKSNGSYGSGSGTLVSTQIPEL